MQQMEFFPESPSGKMSQAHSAATEEQTSTLFSQRWMTSGHWANGGMCWTRSISESPKDVAECSSSLSLILQSSHGSGMEKYFLSAKAAEGILRRATKRGKNLPVMLREALVSATLRD